VSFVYESLLACKAFHEAVLGVDGPHEFTQCVLGPSDTKFKLDIADGHGERPRRGCGFAWLLADIEAKIDNFLEAEGLTRDQIYVHGHFSPPCNGGHPMNTAPDAPERRRICRISNHWTYEVVDELIKRKVFNSASLENGAFCKQQWVGEL